jgi:hypothetical protein
VRLFHVANTGEKSAYVAFQLRRYNGSKPTFNFEHKGVEGENEKLSI